MPAPPYAQIQISVNGGPPTSASVAVSPGDSIQLTGAQSAYWDSNRWEIYGFPPGWTAPGGWTHDTQKNVFFSTAVVPPALSDSGKWGKWLPRLIVNEGVSGSPPRSNPAYTDESIGWHIVSPNFGLVGMVRGETNQFDALTWADQLASDLAAIDLAAFGGSAPRTEQAGQFRTARVASTANIAALTGLLTIDTVTVADGDRVFAKNQSTASQNGLWVAHAGAWTRPPDWQTSLVTSQSVVRVAEGSQAGKWYALTTTGVITVGTTGLTFAEIPVGGGGSFTAGQDLSAVDATHQAVVGISGAAGVVDVSATSFLKRVGTGALSIGFAALAAAATPQGLTLSAQDAYASDAPGTYGGETIFRSGAGVAGPGGAIYAGPLSFYVGPLLAMQVNPAGDFFGTGTGDGAIFSLPSDNSQWALGTNVSQLIGLIAFNKNVDMLGARNNAGSGDIAVIGTNAADEVLLGRTGATAVTTPVHMRASFFEIGASGPTITAGAGAPATTPPDGSAYHRTNGTATTTLYVRAAGAWTALGAGGASSPTGTGLAKVSGSAFVAAASLLIDADVSASAAIAGSKLQSSTSSNLGVIQLTNDLGGTATAPNVVALTGAGGLVNVRSTAALTFGTTPATAGAIRMQNNTALYMKGTAANNARMFTVDGSDNVLFGDTSFLHPTKYQSGGSTTMGMTGDLANHFIVDFGGTAKLDMTQHGIALLGGALGLGGGNGVVYMRDADTSPTTGASGGHIYFSDTKRPGFVIGGSADIIIFDSVVDITAIGHTPAPIGHPEYLKVIRNGNVNYFEFLV